MLNKPHGSAHRGVVPPSHPLEMGQRDKPSEKCINSGTTDGAIDLKALASNILARDKTRDNSGTKGTDSVPPTVKGPGQKQHDVWDAADWQAFYDERAGIAEHDGGLAHLDAEHMAFEHCVVLWLNRNAPAHSDPATCPECCHPIGTNALAVLTGNGGHLWLHDRCHAPWLARRRQEAVAALAGMGIICAIK